MDPISSDSRPPTGRQQARASLKLGDRVHLAAAVDVTSAGLLSIGALVSAILLSTAVIVHVARRPVAVLPETGEG